MNCQSSLMRVDERFRNYVLDIIEERKQLQLKRLSFRKITLLIIRHNSFSKVKADIVNYVGYDDE